MSHENLFGGTLPSMKHKFPNTKSLEEAFELRVVRGEGENDCWGWIGTINGSGYPELPARVGAHRWMLEKKIGRPTKGRSEPTRHICGNKLCTNPRHLSTGTVSENVNDKTQHFNGKFGSHPCWKMTQERADEVRNRREQGVSLRKLAKEFDCSVWTIRNIISHTSWNVNYRIQRAIQSRW